MKGKRLLVLIGVICLALIIAVIPFVGCAKEAPAPAPTPTPTPTPAPTPTPTPAPPEVIELDWVSFLPGTFEEVTALQELFVDRVNERAKGELVIKYRGGPEVFPPDDIGSAVQSGVVDMGVVYVGAYEPVVPGVGGAMLTQLTLDEERQPGGAYDYLLEMHKKVGLYYLGRGHHTGKGFFYCWLREKRVEKPEDLVGLIIGGTTAARPAVLAWGATHTPIALAESYSAMERGVVDAITAQPPASWRDFSNYEVSKYVIDYGYYACTVAVFMNLDSFNQLPKHLQNLLTETFIEAEKDIMIRAAKGQDEAMAFMVDNGLIEPIKFSPADAKWYLEAAYEGAWDYQQERFPEVTPKLRELLTK